MVLESLLSGVLNRLLAAYVEDLSTSNLNANVWSGDVKLKNLKLKKSAMDKFRLPIDVREGYIGELTLSIPWSNLRGQPVKVRVQNVFLVAVPTANVVYDPEEDAERAQQLKMEKLESAEILSAQPATGLSEEEQQKNESFTASLINRVVDNLQVTVSNVHVRYEDDQSVPGHPFSIGFTLSEFSAISTDENWIPSFIHNSLKGIHKLATLESLAIYFNCDDPSMIEEDGDLSKFSDLIATSDHIPNHQFILRPVSGTGRLVLNHHPSEKTPKTDAELLFKELGFVIGEDQYNSLFSMIDLFHFYTRQRHFKFLRPPNSEFEENRPRTLFRYAQKAILYEIHEKHKVWTWDHLKERRDDRTQYVDLFKRSIKEGANFAPDERAALEKLERKLGYKDIRFYRSLARSQLRKERIAEKPHDDNKQQNASGGGGWLSWIWGSSSENTSETSSDENLSLNPQARQELYEAIDWDETEVGPTIDLPKDAIKLRLLARLETGSFTLRRGQQQSAPITEDIVSILFSDFSINWIQRIENFTAAISLESMRVDDGTVKGTLHPQIVRVLTEENLEMRTPLVQSFMQQSLENSLEQLPESETGEKRSSPFFHLEFDYKPIHTNTDMAILVQMRPLEIVYHHVYVEEIYKFFRPPESSMESVNALIDVASETLEGIRKETRAGLEFALQKHKTIDLRVDIDAPIIVIPEDVTIRDCQHLVLDAGHLSVQSKLADQEALSQVKSKQSQVYNEEDYERLESLMYDQFFVTFNSVQLFMGGSYDQCLEVLKTDESSSLHLLERINIAFKVEISIIPKAPNLTKCKVSGQLPELQVNFSDKKYKTLMRLIDVTLPKFDDDFIKDDSAPNISTRRGFRSSNEYIEDDASIFDIDGSQTVNDDSSDDDEDGQHAVFFDAQTQTTGKSTTAQLHQKMFHLTFNVDRLVVSIFKAHQHDFAKPDTLLANAVLEGFRMDLSVRPMDLSVDILLKTLYIEDKIVEHGSKFRHLVTSKKPIVTESDSSTLTQDLMRIKYSRCQADSPEFYDVFNGMNQSVDVELSTFNFILTRGSVLILLDFVLSTFVPGDNNTQNQVSLEVPNNSAENTSTSNENSDVTDDQMSIHIQLDSIVVILNDNDMRLATLSLSSADVSLLFNGPTMKVTGKLGGLNVVDDVNEGDILPEYKQLLSIRGDQVAYFVYETFDKKISQPYPGYDSFFYLRAESLQFILVETSLHRLLNFFSKFAKMKAVFDAAKSNDNLIDNDNSNRMKYDILVKTPIIVAALQQNNPNKLIANLGQISASNSFESNNDEFFIKTTAGLSSIRLSSEFEIESKDSIVKTGSVRVLHDVNLTFDIVQVENLDRKKNQTRPTTRITSHLSDVKISLTQEQYCFFINLSQILPRAFVVSEEESKDAEESGLAMRSRANSTVRPVVKGSNSEVHNDNTLKSPRNGEDQEWYPEVEVVFSAGSLSIDLYSAGAHSQKVVKDYSLARFALNSPSLKFVMLSNNAMEAEVTLKTLSFHDTRSSVITKWREIIPASKSEGNQFVASLSISGEATRNAIVNVNIDAPTIIFSLDPLSALLLYFTSAFQSISPQSETSTATELKQQDENEPIPDATSDALSLALRINITDAKVVLLADPERLDSEAIIMHLDRLLLAQQGTLAISLEQMGMSLCRMDREKLGVQILDKLNASFSWNNTCEDDMVSSIEMDVQKIILRLSYRDILLISSIVTKAMELSSQVNQTRTVSNDDDTHIISAETLQVEAAKAGTTSMQPIRAEDGEINSEVVLVKESLQATFGGMQLVLVGDVHELPLLDLHAPKFMVKASNWSSNLKSSVTISPVINYFNLKNSHWEPLMDPWEFSIKASKSIAPESFTVNVSSRRRAELNITAAFVEIALAQAMVWSRQDYNNVLHTRGESTPFRICNRTGHTITVSCDSPHERSGGSEPVTIENGGTVPWRFDDWRTVRDNLASGYNVVKIELQNSPWTPVRNVSVDRQGRSLHTLSPKINQVSHRLYCDVKLRDNIKFVTLRSTFSVENSCLLPIEMVVVDSNGKKASEVWKIEPDSDCPIPIEAVYSERIKIRPNAGFGYAWSNESYHWKDLIKRPSRTVTCKSNTDEPPFRFQAYAIHDREDPITRVYPSLTLRLRAPVEIENLLPYDIKFRVFDKNREHNWSSFLRRGGTSPMHVTELSHLLLLSVEIQDTPFKKSEFSIINTDNKEDLPVEDIMVLTDKDNLELRLQLNYVKYPDSGGAFKVQILCPYVLINKSGLPLTIKAKPSMSSAKLSAGQELLSPDSSSTLTPFLFSYPTKDNKNRAMLRVGNSSWSKPLSFEAVGTLNEVTVSNTQNMESIIGINVTEGLGQYKLTKVITIYPRYIIRNELDAAIRVRSIASTEYTSLSAGERKPLHALHVGSRRQLMACFDTSRGPWSSPINMQDVGLVHLRLPQSDRSEVLCRVDIALQQATIFVRFSKGSGDYPFLIKNESDFIAKISQTDLIEDSEDERRTRRGYTVSPHDTLPYAWDYPSAMDKMVKLTINGYEREINVMEIGSLKPFQLSYQGQRYSIAIDIKARGTAQEITLSKFVEENSVYKIQSLSSLSRQNSTVSNTSGREVDFVEKSTGDIPSFSLSVSFEGVGISVINSRMDELAYISFRGLSLNYTDSQLYQTVDLSLKWIQVDNQLYGGLFPILLYPTVIPKDSKELDLHPNLQASVTLLKDQAHGVMHFKYASVLLQEMTVEIDEDFLFAVMDFSKLSELLWSQDAKDQLTSDPPEIVEPNYESGNGDVYFEVLHLQPLQVNISFMRTETLNSDNKIFETNQNPIAFFLNAITMTLGNVNDAPVRLNALVLENTRSSIGVLVERITFHYSQEFFSQLYRVLGSADFLGNPVGLFSNVSSGVADIFYEPISGFIVHGNRELGIGIARGAGSFIKKTVFGLSDSFSKVTGSIGKGLSAATLDREFQNKRRMKQNRNRPKHALYGVTAGATSFVTSVASGFEGLAMRPIEGAESGGAPGFIRGIGKGLVGAFTKPVVGIFDMASNVTEGIRNTTTVFDQSAIDRVRIPRFISNDGILRPYQEREALGQMWLKTTENGKYFNEKYSCHVDVSSDGDEIIVILTEKRILLLKALQLKVGWDVPLSDLATINLERRGISLILRGGINGPFLPLPEQSTRLWFFRNIEKL